MQSMVEAKVRKRATAKKLQATPGRAAESSRQDLRSWLAALRVAGEVQEVSA